MTRSKPLPLRDNVVWISADAAGKGRGWTLSRKKPYLDLSQRSKHIAGASRAFAASIAEEFESFLHTRMPTALMLALLGGFVSASSLALLSAV